VKVQHLAENQLIKRAKRTENERRKMVYTSRSMRNEAVDSNK
jgi:hypothetical protein